MSLTITANLSVSQSFKRRAGNLSSKVDRASLIAVNDTLRFGRAKSKREILKQVNFSAGYLDGRDSSQPRLKTVFARRGNLSGKIVGRSQPTSLARFDARKISGAPGVSVRVKGSGGRTKIPRGFLVNLKNGNRGLAVRLPKGETPLRRYTGRPFYQNASNNVFLLYGPSVNQVFDDVAEDIKPDLDGRLEATFLKQANRLNVGL